MDCKFRSVINPVTYLLQADYNSINDEVVTQDESHKMFMMLIDDSNVQKLSSKLRDYVNNDDDFTTFQDHVSPYHLGEIVAFQVEDGNWCRCQIVKIHENKEYADLCLIDKDKVALDVSLSDLRKIKKDRLLKFPSLIKTFCLEDMDWYDLRTSHSQEWSDMLVRLIEILFSSCSKYKIELHETEALSVHPKFAYTIFKGKLLLHCFEWHKVVRRFDREFKYQGFQKAKSQNRIYMSFSSALACFREQYGGSSSSIDSSPSFFCLNQLLTSLLRPSISSPNRNLHTSLNVIVDSNDSNISVINNGHMEKISSVTVDSSEEQKEGSSLTKDDKPQSRLAKFISKRIPPITSTELIPVVDSNLCMISAVSTGEIVEITYRDVEKSLSVDENEIDSEENFDLCLIKGVLIHSEGRSLTPVDSIEHWTEVECVEGEFEEAFTSFLTTNHLVTLDNFGRHRIINQLQSVLWPCMSRNRDAVICCSNIEMSRSSYILPILHCILTTQPSTSDQGSTQSSSSNSPVAVVICENVKAVYESYVYTADLLKDLTVINIRMVSNEEHVVAKFIDMRLVNKSSFKDLAVHLYNGCEILFSTPSDLLEVAEKQPVLSLDKCRFLVVEGLDAILDSDSEDLKSMLELFKGDDIQKLMFSNEWNVNLKSFLFGQKTDAQEDGTTAHANDSEEYIGSDFMFLSMFDAIIYSSTNIQNFAKLFSGDEETEKRAKIEYLKGHCLQSGCLNLVFCCDSTSASSLTKSLLVQSSQMRFTSTTFDENLTKDSEIRNLLKKSMGTSDGEEKKNETRCLIITDEMLSNAVGVKLLHMFLKSCVIKSTPMNLIHFELPSRSKTIFEKRLSFLAQSLHSVYNEDYEDGQAKDLKKHKNFILLSQSSDYRKIKTLLSFLQRSEDASSNDQTIDIISHSASSLQEIKSWAKSYQGKLRFELTSSRYGSSLSSSYQDFNWCPNLLTTGVCQNTVFCSHNHEFNLSSEFEESGTWNRLEEWRQQDLLRRNCYAIFDITHIYQPNRFAVKMRYLTSNPYEMKSEKLMDLEEVGMKLEEQLFLQVRSKLDTIEIDDVECDLPVLISDWHLDQHSTLYRATFIYTQSLYNKNTQVIDNDKNYPIDESTVKVKLYLWDEGLYLERDVKRNMSSSRNINDNNDMLRLYAMPDQFHLNGTFPMLSSQVILLGVKSSESTDWHYDCKNMITDRLCGGYSNGKETLEDREEGPISADFMCRSPIRLALASNVTPSHPSLIFVNRIEVLEETSQREACVVVDELKTCLIEFKFASDDPTHWKRLVKNVPVIADFQKRVDEMDEHQKHSYASGNRSECFSENRRANVIQQPSAFLNFTSINRVVVTRVISPSCFYVRRLDFDRQLCEIERYDLKANSNKLPHLYVGGHCVYKQQCSDSESLNKRAVITDIHYPDNSVEKLNLFLIDYGTEVKNVDYDLKFVTLIDQFHLQKLPSQSIQCHLSNVKPTHAANTKESKSSSYEWSVEVIDAFIELTTDNKPLECVSSGKVKMTASSNTIDHKMSVDSYEVLLTYADSTTFSSVSQALVDSSLVEFERESKFNLAAFLSDAEDSDGNGTKSKFNDSEDEEIIYHTTKKVSKNECSGEELLSTLDVTEQLDAHENFGTQLKKLTYPEGMPCSQLIQDVTACFSASDSKLPLNLTWSENLKQIRLDVKFQLTFDHDVNFLSVQVERNVVRISYLEILQTSTNEDEYILHKVPDLDLKGEVIPHSTSVECKLGSGFMIRVQKRPPSCLWGLLTQNVHEKKRHWRTWLVYNMDFQPSTSTTTLSESEDSHPFSLERADSDSDPSSDEEREESEEGEKSKLLKKIERKHRLKMWKEHVSNLNPGGMSDDSNEMKNSGDEKKSKFDSDDEVKFRPRRKFI